MQKLKIFLLFLNSVESTLNIYMYYIKLIHKRFAKKISVFKIFKTLKFFIVFK